MWHNLLEVDSEALLPACPLPEEVERLQPMQLLRWTSRPCVSVSQQYY